MAVNTLELKSLLEWATPRQKAIAEARIKGETWEWIYNNLGVDQGNGRKTLASLKRRAVRQGYSPDHDMTHTVPDGFHVKGVSTYYDSEGNPKAQWVKSATDQARQIEILLDRIENGCNGFKPFKPTAVPRRSNDNLLSLLTITDFHLGMYAYEAETGDDWDINIARDVFLNAIHQMVNAAPISQVGMLNQLGDFLHWDGLLAVTPMSGHVLDADTRYEKLVDLSMEIMAQAVRIMLKKFPEVHVIQAEGNHDMAGSVWMRKHMKHIFANEPRVTVDDSALHCYAYLHGETMLGFHHGHKVKLASLPKLFSSEPRFRAMWGKAKQTYIHTGHLHYEKVVEDGGAIAEQHPTLAGRDAYAARGGWVSMRGAKMITYDKIDGEIHRITVRPRNG